jgi:hypothetical protein
MFFLFFIKYRSNTAQNEQYLSGRLFAVAAHDSSSPRVYELLQREGSFKI